MRNWIKEKVANSFVFPENRLTFVSSCNGVFSVSDSTQVVFSQGNLQYRASTNTWRFATNQWDYMGSANSNISQTYSNWIDLFGWGTSGWNCGNTYYHPWDCDNSNGSLYGPPGYYDLTGLYANSDWGRYNRYYGRSVRLVRSAQNYSTAATLTINDEGYGSLGNPYVLAFTGEAPTGVPIELNPGWNWISYLLTTEQPLSFVLSGLTPHDGDIIKSQNTFATYNATLQVWNGSLNTFIPGKGYMYLNNSGQTKVFYYPSE